MSKKDERFPNYGRTPIGELKKSRKGKHYELLLKIMDASVTQPNHLLPEAIDGDLGIRRTNEQCPFPQSLELCIALRVGAVPPELPEHVAAGAFLLDEANHIPAASPPIPSPGP